MLQRRRPARPCDPELSRRGGPIPRRLAWRPGARTAGVRFAAAGVGELSYMYRGAVCSPRDPASPFSIAYQSHVRSADSRAQVDTSHMGQGDTCHLQGDTSRAQVDTCRAQGDTFPPQVDTFRPEGGTFTPGPCKPCKPASPCGALPLRSAGFRVSRGFPGSRTRCRRSRGNRCLCSRASRRPRRW